MTAQGGARPGGDLAWLLDDLAAGHGSCLAALCAATADAGLIAYEVAMLVKRAGPHLPANPRFPAIPIAVE